MPDVVVVESPAKAETINKYLGGNYTFLASLGHVRDLPPKDGSVRPDQDFAMDWAADERGLKQVAAIAKALKGARTLYLATDQGVFTAAAGQGVATTWSRLGTDLPNASVNDLTLGPDGYIYAATHGRGIWRIGF